MSKKNYLGFTLIGLPWLRQRSWRKNPLGFTLIELLIAITILAILFGAVSLAAKKVLLKSRDNQRLADLHTIQAALQQYYSDYQNFPTALDLHVMKTLNNCNIQATTSTGCPPTSKTYLNKIPQDPTYSGSGALHYCYQSYKDQSSLAICNNISTNCNYYILQARLESQSTSTLTCNDNANITGAPASNHTGNFRLDPLGL